MNKELEQLFDGKFTDGLDIVTGIGDFVVRWKKSKPKDVKEWIDTHFIAKEDWNDLLYKSDVKEAIEGLTQYEEHDKECLGEFCDDAFCNISERRSQNKILQDLKDKLLG